MKSLILRTIQSILSSLSRATLRKYQPGIIGITGSVGKTSTKTAVFHILKDHRRARTAKKNFNNEFGIPLTILGEWDEIRGLFFWPRVCIGALWRLIFRTKYPELLILEYGADRPGDIRALIDIARPNIAVITAIGEIPTHVEFFTGPDAVAREKARLIEALPAAGLAVLNADDEAVLNIRERTRAQVMTFGSAESADMKISQFENRSEHGVPQGILFKLENGGSFVPVRIDGAFGLPHAYAAAAAASIGLIFGINLVKIAEALKTYTPPNGRMRLIDGIKGSFVIDDTYNAAPLSMRRALETVRDLGGNDSTSSPQGRTIAVLGDMREIGKYAIEAHEAIGEVAADIADILVTVGPHGMFIAGQAVKSGMNTEAVHSFDTADEAKIPVQNLLKEGDIVLIKGSQAMRMEKIVKEIMQNPQDASTLLVRQSAWWKKR